MKFGDFFKKPEKKDPLQEAEEFKKAGRFDKALEGYRNVLAADPSNLKAWYDKASIHLTTGAIRAGS